MSEEEWDVKKLIALQERERKDRPVQGVLLVLPTLAPKVSLGSRINESFEDMKAKVKAPGLRDAILWKVARALCEGRIEEARIASIFPRLEMASNRGAYFVACAKGAFLAVGLSWLEEEWPDA